MNKGISSVAGLAIALSVSSVASAAYNETVNGDLANAYATPTVISVAPEARTTVSGSIAGAGNHVPSDRDWFTFNVPAGQYFVGFHVNAGTVGSGTGSFIGLLNGSTGLDPDTAPPVLGPQTLGYYLYGANNVGTNILPDLGTFTFAGFQSIGFSAPLPAGDYTFWMQEGDAGTFNYSFDIELSAVPEPTTLGLLMAGTTLVARRRRQA